MDEFISVIHENWDIMTDPTTLAAYTLWRINWIHPFIEGNGRTSYNRIWCLEEFEVWGVPC